LPSLFHKSERNRTNSETTTLNHVLDLIDRRHGLARDPYDSLASPEQLGDTRDLFRIEELDDGLNHLQVSELSWTDWAEVAGVVPVLTLHRTAGIHYVVVDRDGRYRPTEVDESEVQGVGQHCTLYSVHYRPTQYVL